MSYPTKYTRQYDYVSYQNANPSRPLPAGEIHADLNQAARSSAEIVDFLKQSLRADGAVANGSIGYEQLAPALQLSGLAPANPWAASAEYAVGDSVIAAGGLYRALVAHTSTDFNNDLAAGKWLFVATLASGPQGPQGPQGAQGPQGEPGAQGPQGPAVVAIYDTRTAVQAATIPGSINQIQTTGYAAIGDGGGSIATNAVYKRVGSLPGHSGYIQSADGAYWELTGPWVSVKQFGAVAAVANIDTDPDCAAAINLCMAYCNLKQANMLLPSGLFPLDSAIAAPTFIIEMAGSQGGSQPTILYKRYTEASGTRGVLSFGAWGATVNDIQIAAKAGTSGGSGLSAILPNNAANIGVLRCRNLYISCGDCVIQSLYINGFNNTGGVGGTGGKGYRSAYFEDCHFFGASTYSVVILGGVNINGSNVYTDVSGGSGVYGLYCQGNATVPSRVINWSGACIGGRLFVDYVDSAIFDSTVQSNVENTSTVSSTTVTSVLGTVQQNWTNSGVLNSGAWATSSPVPTASSGTLTTASSTIAYKKVGKILYCEGSITVTTVGTGTGTLSIQLPFTLVRTITFAGRENVINGLVYGASITTAGVLSILKYDNTTAIAAGATFPFSFTAEAA